MVRALSERIVDFIAFFPGASVLLAYWPRHSGSPPPQIALIVPAFRRRDGHCCPPVYKAFANAQPVGVPMPVT
jgi:hypothetical protein